jgi:phenylpropionate dioxygenase-like ring-hydroxylating dioxygenase large terminal subunit
MQMYFISLAVGFVLVAVFVVYKQYTLPPRSNIRAEKKWSPEVFLENIPKEIQVRLDPLNMKDYWYPIAFSSQVTSTQPFASFLLDEPLVFYRGKDEKIVCAQDLCPHRSAKLSIGRMMNGNIECAYHGWQYGVNGKCEKVPSVAQNSAFEKNVCLDTKPCIETMGIIFVWLGNPSLAHDSLIPRFMIREREWKGWNFFEDSIDLDFPHELMVDNLLDNAHVDFTHDGTIGSRSKASHVEYKEVKDDIFTKSSALSFQYSVTKPERMEDGHANFTFIPPCFVKLRIAIKEDQYLYQNLMMIPTQKHKMRLLISFHQNFIPRFITEYFLPTSLGQYLSLKSSRKIVDQDNELLRGIFENNGMNAKPYSKIVGSDIMIKRYREEFLIPAMKNDPWFKGFGVKDIEDLK